MSDLTISDSVMDLRMNLSRLKGIVDEVEEHIAAGKLDSAALVLGSQTEKIDRFAASYSGLQEKLREEGADPQRALH